MSETDWSRPRWTPGGGTPFFFLVVYGLTDVPSPVHALSYRTRGLPEGVDVYAYRREDRDQAAYLAEYFEEGHPWEDLVTRDVALSQSVLASPGALVLKGDADDSDSLLYLRDVIGFIAWLADNGAVAVYDPMTFRWWSAQRWKERFFEPDKPDPQAQVMIYRSTESDGIWLYTRGLIAFGRPDLSMPRVPKSDFENAAGMCNELITHQALGGVLAEGQIVRHPVLGPFVVHHEGDRDDPEFNNAHVELLPEGATRRKRWLPGWLGGR